MKKGLGLVSTLLLACALFASGIPAANAAPGDLDDDGIADHIDAWPTTAYRKPLLDLRTSNLRFDVGGAGIALPASLYWKTAGSSSLSVVSADIDSHMVLGTRIYEGPVFLTNLVVRDLLSLNLDADIMIGVTLNTSAYASSPASGAVVKGSGLCISLGSVDKMKADLERASGMKATAFNLPQVVERAAPELGLDLGACSFELAIRNNAKLFEIWNPASPLFPGFGSADRMGAKVWGSVAFDAAGWRIPLNLRIPGVFSFVNGRPVPKAVTE